MATGSGRPALVATATLAAGLGVAWLFSRSQQSDIEARTRARLQPRPDRHAPPSAADIRVR